MRTQAGDRYRVVAACDGVEMLSTRDGVELAVERMGGSGPPLVLVHGGATDSRCFDPLVPLLQGYAVVRYDRRGHGRSTGTATADLRAETDDLRAVVTSLGEPALVLGYSYGALITLRAMTEWHLRLRGAVLYEPPMAVPGMLPGSREVVELVEREEHDAAAALFVSRTFHLGERAVGAMRRHPSWSAMVALMPTLPPELEAITTSQLPQPPVTAPPTRVLVAAQGGNPAFVEIAEHLSGVLPACDVVRVPGLPHFAIATDPQPFVRAVDEHFARC